MGRKMEFWVLLPDPAIHRVTGLKGRRGRGVKARLNDLYGSREWQGIYELRDANEIDAGQARAEYVNLYRWRIEKELGYWRTHALQLETDEGRPLYTMIFATDHPAGDKIMRDVYQSTTLRTIPELKSSALAMSIERAEAAAGVQSLFKPPPPRVEARQYRYEPPWRPRSAPLRDVEFVEDPSADADLDKDDEAGSLGAQTAS